MSGNSTRERILDAAVALHEEVGPADTTISAIAERAKVQRLTVYRLFPDEAALIQGCSAHWSARHPPPDPARWSGIADPRDRLAVALRALYRYYEEGGGMIGSVLRDEEKVPALREVLVSFHAYRTEVAGALAAGWGCEREQQRFVRAAVGHALDFWSWDSLAGEGLELEEAVDLMVAFVSCVAGGGSSAGGENAGAA